MYNRRVHHERSRTKRRRGERKRISYFHLRERIGKSVLHVAQDSIRKRGVIIK